MVVGHEDATELVSAAALTIDRDPTRDTADAEDPPLPPGTVLGRYVIIEAIGRGGMGHVYAARDPELERRVAIKTLRRRSVSQFGSEQLLLAEAQALAKLSHPNVVTVYDAGTHGDAIFIAMEHIEGITVQRWLETDAPPWHAILDVFLRAGAGLAAAHRNGIIHRDFKPSNVMIDADRVRVVDFGLALTSERDAVRSSIDNLESSSGGVKSPRIVVGTPGFMAPEQMDNEGVDERSDQFSYCVSLWTALYGVRPFAGTKVGALRRAILGRALQEPARMAGPRRIRKHLARGLEADPARRWPSMEALLEKLESDRRLPRRRAIGGALVGAAIVLPTAGYVLATTREPDPCPEPRLAEVWDETRAQAIEAAFGSSGKPFAAQVWATTKAQLDTWALGWVDASQRACRAARVDRIETDEVFERRARCLTSARTELAAMVEHLQAADDATVTGAVKAVAALPSPQRCADAELDDAPRPGPAIADRVAEIEHELAGIKALMRTAGWAKAAAELEPLVAEAQQVQWGPLLADVLLARGEALTWDKRFDEAEPLLLEALWTAMPIEHDLTAAAVWVHLVRLEVMRGKLDEAERFSRHAQAFVPRLHGVPQLEFDLVTNRGLVAFARGNYEEATNLYDDALARSVAMHGERHIRVAASHNNLGTVYGVRGDHAAAVEQFEKVYALTKDLLGEMHPDVSAALGNIAVSKQKLDQIDEARVLHARVIEINEKVLGPDHADTGMAYGNLGAMEQDAGRSELAVEYLGRALRIKERTIGADHPSTSLTRTNLGTALTATGRAAEALPHLQRAHDQLIAVLGVEHPNVFYARLALGRALSRLERASEALLVLEAAVASRAHDDSDEQGRAEAELELAKALAATKGDDARAVALARDARERFLAVGTVGKAGASEAEAFLRSR